MKIKMDAIETPSLQYLHSLAKGNGQFENKIIKVLIKELPYEYEVYQKAIKSKNYFFASESVHKIKHKIAFFQMKNAYSLAEAHELSLREGQLIYQGEFLEIITKIINFLSDCMD